MYVADKPVPRLPRLPSTHPGLMRAFLAAVAVPAAVHAAGEWKEWVSVHAKVYASDVQARYRQSVFEANLLSFAEQTRYDTATFGPDAYADLTVDEFVAARAGCFTGNGFDSISPAPAVALLRHRVGDDTSVDWRDPTKNPAKVNGVTRVKNQGPYGYVYNHKYKQQVSLMCRSALTFIRQQQVNSGGTSQVC